MRNIALAAVLMTLLSGCYSFRGISIDPSINTFYVANFEEQAPNAIQLLGQTFAEALRDKIRNESRLIYNDTDPDIEFKGTITTYRVTSEAPEPGETTSFNRLTVGVRVEYTNNQLDEDEEGQNWTSSFSFFQDFPSTTNILDVQQELLDAIIEQLVEDIFNRAFTNW